MVATEIAILYSLQINCKYRCRFTGIVKRRDEMGKWCQSFNQILIAISCMIVTYLNLVIAVVV